MDCIQNEKQVLQWKILSSLVNELNLIRCLWFLWSCLTGYRKIMRDTPKTIVNLKFWWQGNVFFRFLGFSKPYSCQENFLCKSLSFKMITFQLPTSHQFTLSFDDHFYWRKQFMAQFPLRTYNKWWGLPRWHSGKESTCSLSLLG